MKKPRRGAGLSSLRGLAEMRVNGKPTDAISQKAPPGSGAKFEGTPHTDNFLCSKIPARNGKPRRSGAK